MSPPCPEESRGQRRSPNARSGVVLGLRRPEFLPAVVLACFDGLALQRLAQPDVDLAAAYDVLKAAIVPTDAGVPHKRREGDE